MSNTYIVKKLDDDDNGDILYSVMVENKPTELVVDWNGLITILGGM